MSHHQCEPLHLTGGGNAHFDLKICISDLDLTILSGNPEQAHAFIQKWGEEMREYLIAADRRPQFNYLTKAA
jgi:hypothetical protein